MQFPPETVSAIRSYAKSACARYRLTSAFDDVHQDAWVAAVQAYTTFDPDRGGDVQKRVRWIASKEANRSAKDRAKRGNREQTNRL